ncbi:MAG TPA: hypothetical protein VGL89_04110 [Candidatus Koribacter sp.]
MLAPTLPFNSPARANLDVRNRIQPIMSGILHIFRSQPDIYQVNYTLGVTNYVRTCTREQLEHLLVTPAALDDALIAGLFDELNAHDKVTVSDVSITPNQVSSHGFEPMPSDA